MASVCRWRRTQQSAHASRLYICGGTPDNYDACWVEPSEIEAYLRERRPNLFQADALP